MTQDTLKKSSLKASFNGLDYKFSQNNNLGYRVVVGNVIKNIFGFDVEYMDFGYGEKHFTILANKNLEVPQIVYDTMEEISEYLKKENFGNEFLKGWVSLGTYRMDLRTEWKNLHHDYLWYE